ncbi:BrnA antitoxin family protein [Gluconacetobacter sp. Hr-1-5]|uniref:BrnA antitoxin family protein n=1 Tax=Gluconacetobacter sp. Hr-1-5 TaxID=3395370 RepID=UPI003B52E822
MKRKIDPIYPTDEEDAAINRGIALDADNPELTDQDFAHMREAAEVVPDIVEDYRRRVHGSQKAPAKKAVSIRLDADVVERLKAGGPGWQERANEMLRRAVLNEAEG